MTRASITFPDRAGVQSDSEKRGGRLTLKTELSTPSRLRTLLRGLELTLQSAPLRRPLMVVGRGWVMEWKGKCLVDLWGRRWPVMSGNSLSHRAPFGGPSLHLAEASGRTHHGPLSNRRQYKSVRHTNALLVSAGDQRRWRHGRASAARLRSQRTSPLPSDRPRRPFILQSR